MDNLDFNPNIRIYIATALIFIGIAVISPIILRPQGETKKDIEQSRLEYSLKINGINPERVKDWEKIGDIEPKGGDGIDDYQVLIEPYGWTTIQGYNPKRG